MTERAVGRIGNLQIEEIQSAKESPNVLLLNCVNRHTLNFNKKKNQNEVWGRIFDKYSLFNSNIQIVLVL